MVEVNEKYKRPLEVNSLIADPTKANNELNWNSGYGITFRTPLGPIRIDVAYKKAEGNPTISNALLYIFK